MTTIEIRDQISELAERFAACSDILTAIGDETRLHIILATMTSGKCEGLRVGEITKMSNLSRPAVSHHLQILKAAGIVNVRKDGTKNYYYFNRNMESFKKLAATINLALEIYEQLPNEHKEDEGE